MNLFADADVLRAACVVFEALPAPPAPVPPVVLAVPEMGPAVARRRRGAGFFNALFRVVGIRPDVPVGGAVLL